MKAAAFSLVVLTLNVAGPRRVHQGWPTRREFISARLQAEKPDAAALQELWRAEDAHALAQAAGHAHRAHDPALGLGLSSRFPIASTASRALGWGAGALRARVKGAAGEFDLYSARLDSGGGLEDRRLGQAFRLAEFVRAESAGRPFALLGDLGAAPDEKEMRALLDLLEARDLCVAHGDEICGRTSGEQRVDYALIPYSSRGALRASASAAFTEPAAGGDGLEPPPRFGLKARLNPGFMTLKPAAEPPGRGETLEELAERFARARQEAEKREGQAGWIPYLGARQSLDARREAELFIALHEEAVTARIRAARRAASP